MPLPSDVAVNQSDSSTPPFRTPTNNNAFPGMSPRSARPPPPLPDVRVAAVHMASFELQKAMFSITQCDQNNKKNNKPALLGALLGPLSNGSPPTHMQVVNNATRLPTKRKWDEVQNTTDLDEDQPACKTFKGKTSAFPGSGKNGSLLVKCLRRRKQ